MKTCSKCRVEKPLGDFYKRNVNKYRGVCKECINRTRASANHSVTVHEKRCPRCLKTRKSEEFHKNRRLAHGLYCYCKSCHSILTAASTYNISELEVERLRASRCEICGSDQNICIDHCHETNIVRGPLCSHCNHGIGDFFDDPKNLEKAVEYLRRHQ